MALKSCPKCFELHKDNLGPDSDLKECSLVKRIRFVQNNYWNESNECHWRGTAEVLWKVKEDKDAFPLGE